MDQRQPYREFGHAPGNGSPMDAKPAGGKVGIAVSASDLAKESASGHQGAYCGVLVGPRFDSVRESISAGQKEQFAEDSQVVSVCFVQLVELC